MRLTQAPNPDVSTQPMPKSISELYLLSQW